MTVNQTVRRSGGENSNEKDSNADSHGGEAQFNWSQRLATLWDRLGVTETEEKESAGTPASLTRALQRGKYFTGLGAVITGAGYLLVPFSPTITSIVVSGLGLIILVNGMTRVRRAKKNLALVKWAECSSTGLGHLLPRTFEHLLFILKQERPNHSQPLLHQLTPFRGD